MKQLLKTIVRTAFILVAIALMWNLAGGWLPTGQQQERQASAAALSVQAIEMAPINAPGLASRSADSPDPNAVVGIT